MSLTSNYQRDWPAYFDAVAAQPARDTLMRALAACERERGHSPTAVSAGVAPVAFDIACGEGRDTRAMLASPVGFRVFALDDSQEALRRLRAELGSSDAGRVEARAMGMEEIAASAGTLPTSAMLINASFALPFCHEDHFPALWAWIVATLAPGGRFAGQMFGDRDEWAAVNPRRHYSRERTLALLGAFDLEHFEEVEKDGSDATGGFKHHHLFHIVARKR
jgi:SAM-dependent methyltransferase